MDGEVNSVLSFPIFLLKLGVRLGHVASWIFGPPTDHERLRMMCRISGDDVGGIDLRVDVPMASHIPYARVSVGIRRFRRVDNSLNFGRLTLLDGHCQTENSLGTGLDPIGIDSRLNQPALRVRAFRYGRTDESYFARFQPS